MTFAYTIQVRTTEDVKETQDINKIEVEVEESFNDYNGTFILRDIKREETFVYNEEIANERYTPASSFKIANSLIGLQVGAVENEYEIKYWDGIDRGEIEKWNEDNTLGSAMRYSVVWYYQDMARDIGEEQMQEWLSKISYGNEDISGGIDQFWLGSSLAISPMEQVEFLEKLYKEDLPFDNNIMRTVKRMMAQEDDTPYVLYGKTGSSPDGPDGQVGWYVGFVENGDDSYVFVTNIDDTGLNAKDITLDILNKHFKQ
ncbi:class D beta-lactamase [Jeotgalibacillus marinus]|uniref:Beta-lactamase n=1 Tax=Jeotgalibacillus marinus TaxID=86667 RepID=A0ABV3Q4S0_9BACL